MKIIKSSKNTIFPIGSRVWVESYNNEISSNLRPSNCKAIIDLQLKHPLIVKSYYCNEYILTNGSQLMILPAENVYLQLDWIGYYKKFTSKILGNIKNNSSWEIVKDQIKVQRLKSAIVNMNFKIVDMVLE